MIIECTNCHTRYHYDEERFAGQASKKIRCARCREVFEIHRPQPPAPPSESRSERRDRKVTAGEDTTRPGHASAVAAVMEPSVEVAVAVTEPESGQPPEDEQPPEPSVSEIPVGLPTGRRLSLAIIDGPGSGKVYRIEKANITIGRSGSDLVLDDTEVSRAHALLEIHDTRVLLEDLGSRNGTLVEGDQIEGTVELQNHSEFTVGSTTIMLIMTEEQ